MADIDDAKDLVLWARKQGIVLGRLRVGAVELEITAMVPASAPLPSEAEAKSGLYAQFGGELLDAVEQETKAEDTYDEED